MRCIHGTDFCDICNKKYPKYKERYEQLKRQPSSYPDEYHYKYYDHVYDNEDDWEKINSHAESRDNDDFIRSDLDPFDYDPD